VSPNTPYEPGDESEREYVPPHQSQPADVDPLANNPYSNQHRQGPAPDLDAGAPQLRSSDLKRMNRRALAFMVLIVALLVVLGIWLLKSSRGNEPPPKPHEETVMVPDAPKPIPLPATPRPTAPIPLAQQQPRLLMPSPQMPSQTPQAQGPRGPTLLERRMMTGDSAAQGVNGGQYGPAGGAGGPGGPAGGAADAYAQAMAGMQGRQQPKPEHQPGDPDPFRLADVSSAQPLNNPDTLMLRGTFIRCVLETRIITDIPGFTSCIVTEPVYSFNGRKLLLPKGSKVLGKYDMVPNGPRVAVIWDRIVTPTGIDVNMASPGVDNLGGSGHPGYINSHWASRIGAALLVSLLSDAFQYEAAEHGPRTTTIGDGFATQTPFQSNTAQTLQTLANQSVQRSANRPPTVTINQGTVLNIYVAKDVDFSGVVARF
jgi:type IV secretion system protein VirB10